MNEDSPRESRRSQGGPSRGSSAGRGRGRGAGEGRSAGSERWADRGGRSDDRRGGSDDRRARTEGGQRGAQRSGGDRFGSVPGGGDELRGGRRLAPKGPRVPEPDLPEEVTGKELDRTVFQQLRTLSKENAEGVARHLVMVAVQLAADDLEAAEAHAATVVRRAGRVPAAREAMGMVAYRKGDFAKALAEFRTVRRLSGSSHLLPLMVDCERGLDRHERALELAASPEAATLTAAERVELAIVVAGVRRDLGQDEAALLALKRPELRSASAPRLHYAYADTLLALGREDEAREWFMRAVESDVDLETDAVERLEELEGTVLIDALDGEEDEDPAGDQAAHVKSEGAAADGEAPTTPEPSSHS